MSQPLTPPLTPKKNSTTLLLGLCLLITVGIVLFVYIKYIRNSGKKSNSDTKKLSSGESCTSSDQCSSNLLCRIGNKTCLSNTDCINKNTEGTDIFDCTSIEQKTTNPSGIEISKGVNITSLKEKINGEKFSRESCRQAALTLGYKAWNFSITPEETSCYGYKDFIPFDTNNKDGKNITGCVNEGEKLSLGCNKPSNTFSIQQPTSGKCLIPDPRVDINNKPNLVFSTNCSQKYIFTSDGAIKHVSSGKCLNPKSGTKNPQNDELTILTDDCKSHQYYFNNTQNIQYKNSTQPTCLHPLGGSSAPTDYTPVVNWMKCDATARIQYIQKKD